MPDYERLAKAIKTTVQGKPEPGELGYDVNGQFRVIDERNARKFYVRFSPGNFVSAFHRNLVPQIPGLPVLVGKNNLGQPVILGTNPALIDQFLSENNAGSAVGMHDHVRNSGMEYIIDTWLLKQLRMTAGVGTNVTVAPGYYLVGSDLRYFAGATLDIAAAIPADFGFQRWVIVSLNTETGALVSTNGSLMYGDLRPGMDTIADVDFLLEGYRPIAAVWINYGTTQLFNYQIEDLRFIFPSQNVLVTLPTSDAVFDDPISIEDIEGAFGVRDTGFVGIMDDSGAGERVFGVAKLYDTWQMWDMSQVFDLIVFSAPAAADEYTDDDTYTFTWS